MRNLDYVIKKTAIDLQLPEPEVRKFLECYWKEVQEQIIDLKSTTIALRKIGVLTVSKLKIRNFIFETIKKIRNTKKSERFSEKNKVIYIEKRKELLRKALVQRNILAIDYAEEFGNI